MFDLLPLMLTIQIMAKQKPRRTEADHRTKSILKSMTDSQKTNPGLSNRQRVSELSPNQEINRLELVVLRTYPRRLVASKNYTGQLAAACGRDETGIVGIVLWDEQVDRVKTGDIIRIEGGWCRSRNQELVVSTGKNGRLYILDR